MGEQEDVNSRKITDEHGRELVSYNQYDSYTNFRTMHHQFNT